MKTFSILGVLFVASVTVSCSQGPVADVMLTFKDGSDTTLTVGMKRFASGVDKGKDCYRLEFKDCDLDVVRLPSTLEEIGGGWNCERFEISEEHPRLCLIDGVLFNKEATILLAYPGKKAGERYVVPEGVEKIGDSAFQDCKTLKSVELPQGLKTIGNQAFRECRSLQRVDIPAGLQTLDKMAFCKCDSLEKVVLPKGLKTIGEGAFIDCWSLESVALPEGLQGIGICAFFGCGRLEGVKLPAGLQTLGAQAFQKCNSLRSVELPESLHEIGYAAFPEGVQFSAPSGSWAAKWLGERK